MSIRASIIALWRKFRRRRGDSGREYDEAQSALEKSIEKLGLELSDVETPLEEDEREMIHGIVELGETMVKEIMVPRVEIVGIELGSQMSEVVGTIKKSGYSRFPLYEDSLDDIRGIIYAKDLLSGLLDKTQIDLAQIARKAYFIPETQAVDELLRDLKKRHLHIAIVVDEYGGTSGLVTMEDIIEEIVGEIEDEYDGEPPPIMNVSPGVYTLSGSLTIADLNDELDLELPEEEFETVGGLIYDLVGSLPEKGKTLEYHGVKFVVDQVEGQRIVRVKLVIPENAPEKASDINKQES